MSLNARQLRFVDEYLIDLNATQAAIRAGYSEKTAQQIGSRLLSNVVIAAEIATRQSVRAEKLNITAEYILGRLQENVERAMQVEEVKVFNHSTKELEGTGEYVYEGAVANRALELLGKHIGLFPDRHEHTGKNGGPVQVAASEWRFGDRVIRFGAPSRVKEHTNS